MELYVSINNTQGHQTDLEILNVKDLVELASAKLDRL